MNRLLSAMLLVGACSLTAAAQIFEPSVKIDAEARVDYQYGWYDGNTDDNASGFKGKYLNFQVSGDLNRNFSYSWRQRFNKSVIDSSFFDATDWVYLSYHPNDNWDFSAGKQVVNIGGYEYDRAPIDIFTASEFWNNIPCYQMGASIAYNLKNGKDKFILQATRNPFYSQAQVNNNNTYAYNLMWAGNHGFYSSLWSVNMIEYRKGHYINYISLGNRFLIDHWRLDLDLMNRARSKQTFLFKDCSVMAELSYIHDKFRVYGKVTYDVNHSGQDGDYCVFNGTELTSYCIGGEYFPLRNKRHEVRVHAYVDYTHGTNGNLAGTLRDKTTLVNVGLTWKFNILNYSK